MKIIPVVADVAEIDPMSESEACSLLDDRNNIDIQAIFDCESMKLRRKVTSRSVYRVRSARRRFAARIALVVNVVCN